MPQLWVVLFWCCFAISLLFPLIARKGIRLVWEQKLGVDERNHVADKCSRSWWYANILTVVSHPLT